MKRVNIKKIIIPAAVIIVAAAAIITAVLLSGKEEYRLIKVNSFEGNVAVQRENSGSIDVFNGMKLVSRDSVNVMASSFLDLLADDDKHICAEENTGFILNSSGTSKEGYLTIELLYGKALFTIENKLNENSFFEVKTPNATLSVRGTSFSVEYNIATGETIVEVFEGKVWASYYGKEQILEQGDIVHIKPEDELQPLPIPDEVTPSAPSEGVDFMITRYFQNVPDYVTAPADYLEFYYCSDNSSAAAVVSPSDPDIATVNPTLAESTMQINAEFIDTVTDKIKEDVDSFMGDDFLPPQHIFDITDWYKDLASRTVTITDTDKEYTFEFTKVELSYIYSDMTVEYANEYYGNIPLKNITADGERGMAITGVNITFYSEKEAAPTDFAIGLETPDSNDSISIIVNRAYTFPLLAPNMPDPEAYSSSEVEYRLSLNKDFYLSGEEGPLYYNFYYNKDYSGNRPFDRWAYDFCVNNIEPHSEEIRAWFDANEADNLRADQIHDFSGVEYDKYVTEWFPDTVTINDNETDRTYKITNVRMNFEVHGIEAEEVTDTSLLPENYYLEDNYYKFMGGVSLYFDLTLI